MGFDRVKSLVHTVIGLARCLCAVIKGARDGDVDWQKVEVSCYMSCLCGVCGQGSTRVNNPEMVLGQTVGCSSC